MYNFLMKSRIFYGLVLVIAIIIPNIIETALAPVFYLIAKCINNSNFRDRIRASIAFSMLLKLGEITGDEKLLQLVKKSWIIIWKYYITSSNFEELDKKIEEFKKGL